MHTWGYKGQNVAGKDGGFIIHSYNKIYCVEFIDFSPPLRTLAEAC